MARKNTLSNVVIAFALTALHGVGAEELPKPMFYVPFDGTDNAAIFGGGRTPQLAAALDPILAIAGRKERRFFPGKVGLCYDATKTPRIFRCRGNFRADEGAFSMWISPRFRGDDTNIYCTFFGAANWGMLYKYRKHTSMTFGTARQKGDLYYDCGVRDISSWRPGDWHHVVACWSRRENSRRIYIDGKLQASGPFPFHREVEDGPLFIGSGCTLYPGHVAHAMLDEVAIWARPLALEHVQRLHALGKAGKPLWKAVATASTADVSIQSLPKPEAPKRPPGETLKPTLSRTRQTVSLNGWWHFLPVSGRADLPNAGWGWTRIPGYWTTHGSTIGPDGKVVRNSWRDSSLAELPIGVHQRVFTARGEWKSKNVFLRIGGVDGLAEVYLNGIRVGTLPGWESEAYDIGPKLILDAENVLTVFVHRRGGSRIAGIYGDVSLRIFDRGFVNDIAVRTPLKEEQILFSCDVWQDGKTQEARIEFEVEPVRGAAESMEPLIQKFEWPSVRRTPAELSTQARRIEFRSDWKEPHLWTFDDPFLYRVRARLYLREQLVDESQWHRFGFREFSRRGSDFILNGKTTHLRGHQIDLGWGNQMERVKELKAAGMNCFELSGPIRNNWYAGTPYRPRQFREILDYADEHGLLALPVLPSARILKDRIFEPGVAKLYKRRIDKHIRRFGNHPSIGMWFMNFNLAGYRWYIAPTKIDGSFKPENEAFRQKERYSLEAERIVKQLDERPIYHHACGNFGNIFSLNCYIGPTSPLQEREEWPARWAKKRPFPLLACEHGLMLIPYWFRPRTFPLSVVYADEPVFDELASKYLGPRAWRLLTPELFELYDVGRKPRGSRLRTLIQRHPAYQQVKSLYARHSLRAWRTWGVSGIIFNAINWDFKDRERKPLPVMLALARYFNDTDMYIAGPPGDWPSKDHSYYEREEFRKQIVLLNDLTRDIPCVIEWEVTGPDKKVIASNRVQSLSLAGTPVRIPVEADLPSVTVRTDLALSVRAVTGPKKYFRQERFTFSLFPRPKLESQDAKALVFGLSEETKKMLTMAGLEFAPLKEASNLQAARLVIVGKKSYGKDFLDLARRIQLEDAVRAGLNLLVMEQTVPEVFGLKLEEQSARRVFMADPGHPFFEGLAAQDFIDFRGESHLIPPYPEAPPETQRKWPRRFFKWGNRGVVSTFAFRKPHLSPFVPLLECGFDLVHSPLMAAAAGRGRVVLCQVDVTSRYGVDPISTSLVDNVLRRLTQVEAGTASAISCLDADAAKFLQQFGVETTKYGEANDAKLIAVGAGQHTQRDLASIQSAAENGATVLFLPDSQATSFGLRIQEESLFIGRTTRHRILRGLSDADLFFKKWVALRVGQKSEGWEMITVPGIVALKKIGKGRLVACQLDLGRLKDRGRIKAFRFWRIFLANLGANPSASFTEPEVSVYLPNKWESMPGYINW